MGLGLLHGRILAPGWYISSVTGVLHYSSSLAVRLVVHKLEFSRRSIACQGNMVGDSQAKKKADLEARHSLLSSSNGSGLEESVSRLREAQWSTESVLDRAMNLVSVLTHKYCEGPVVDEQSWMTWNRADGVTTSRPVVVENTSDTHEMDMRVVYWTSSSEHGEQSTRSSSDIGFRLLSVIISLSSDR